MLGNPDLKNIEALQQAALSGGLLVSAISGWEIGMLSSRGRIHLGMPCQEWLDTALSAPGVSLLKLSLRIAVKLSHLLGIFNGDPTYRILLASAWVTNLTLATRDEKILAYAQDGYLNTLIC
jgi:PIN domain nuclease of toxin-antitoxin system